MATLTCVKNVSNVSALNTPGISIRLTGRLGVCTDPLHSYAEDPCLLFLVGTGCIDLISLLHLLLRLLLTPHLHRFLLLRSACRPDYHESI